MYGQTEATTRMSYLYTNQEQSKLNSVGKILKMVDFI